MTRPLYQIADDIIADANERGKPVHFSAVPYVHAMLSLSEMSDCYGEDGGKSIVTYALSNLGSWRGETARRIKAELNQMLKESK